MNVLQGLVRKVSIAPIDGTGATVTALGIDLASAGWIGVKEMMMELFVGNLAADVNSVVWQESGVSNFASDTATVATFTAPTAAAGDGKIWTAFAATGGSRKRYHRCLITCGAGASLVCAVFYGYGAAQVPSTATTRGITGEQQLPVPA